MQFTPYDHVRIWDNDRYARGIIIPDGLTTAMVVMPAGIDDVQAIQLPLTDIISHQEGLRDYQMEAPAQLRHYRAQLEQIKLTVRQWERVVRYGY